MFLRKYGSQILALGIFITLCGAGVLGFYIGTFYPKTIIIKGVDNIEDGIVTNTNFDVFWETWRIIKDSHLHAADFTNKDFVYGAASGLVGALKDPHSVFFNPPDSKKFSEDLSGSFGGIGAEIGFKNDQLTIVAPLKDSPAEKAGLRSGDKIVEINASSTINLNINEAVKLIRGPKGTQVNLTINRNGAEKPIKVNIVRDTINVPVIELKMKDNNIAHLQLFTFNEQSPVLVAEKLEEIKRSGTKGLILDLRNNPGGFLDSAVQIAGLFLEPNTDVVFEEFRSGNREVFKTSGTNIIKNMPMVILINGGSASASEILAGAIRDHLGVKLIGEKSFGKGTVQELKNLHDGSTIKITIAHWILPKGQQIDKNGLEPDIAVKPTEEELEQKKDPQLDKAVETLKSLISE